MDRRQALSQQSTPMSRKRSSLSGTGTSPFTHTRGISPLTIKNWQTSNDEYFNNYTLTSPPKLVRTNSGQKHLPCASRVTVYNPEEYVRQTEMDTGSKCPPLTMSQDRKSSLAMNHISVSPNLPSPLINHCQSPLYSSTPTSAGLTDATTLSHGMSRQSSMGGSICGGMKMMKLQSQTSDRSDFSPRAYEEQSTLPSTIPFDTYNECNINVPQHVHSRLGDCTHCVVQGPHIPTRLFVSDSITQPLKPSSIGDETKMERAKSADINTLSASRIRRRQEQLAHSERRIAPKLSEEAAVLSRVTPTDHSMVRVKSADGKLTEKYQIPKTAYTRPPRAKVRCMRCNEHPEGFRGEHELRRHTDRSHTSVRKVWVCVDGSPDKTMLSRCKACRARKLYGAYYNAAAHLRRVHFNPKEKGRKVRGASERAGKGGGDWPPMEELKRDWIREVEEKVPIDFIDDDDFEEEPIEPTGNINGINNELSSPPVSTTPVDAYHLTTIPACMPAPSYASSLGGDVPRHSQVGLVGELPLTPITDATFDGVFEFDMQPSSDPLQNGFDESLLYSMQSY